MKKILVLVLTLFLLLTFGFTVQAQSSYFSRSAGAYGATNDTPNDVKKYSTTHAALSVSANRNVSTNLPMAMRIRLSSNSASASSAGDFVPQTAYHTFSRSYNSTYSGLNGKGKTFFMRFQTNSADPQAVLLSGYFYADF